MSSIHYSAAWTECGCLISCCHHHRSVGEAVACIRRAGGYVVAVQGGVVRSLTTQEEAEFQCVVPIDSTATEALQITLGPEEIPFDCGYAVMTRIRTGERWIWTTWMRFETYADAAAHARQGDKVVRFRSPEWKALRQQTEATSPVVIKRVAGESVPPRAEGETLLEFVLRLLSAYQLDEDSRLVFESEEQKSLIEADYDIIDAVLNRLDESERSELARMYVEDEPALLEALGNRFHTFIAVKVGRH